MTSVGADGTRNYGHEKSGVGVVPWLAAALIIALGIGVYLLAANVTGESGQRSSGDQAGSGRATTDAGADVFALAANNQLATAVGQAVTVDNARVANVIANDAFWIRNDSRSELFVQLIGIARAADGTVVDVQANQRVDLTATLVATPTDIAALGVATDEDIAVLREQGAYLSANTVAPR